MALQWVAANLRTGRIIADLPSMDPQWPLRRQISSPSTAAAVLHLDGAPENWRDATLPGGALLACYDDTDDTRPIQWAGYVTQRVPDATSDDVQLALATLEQYCDERYVGDVTYTTSQNRDAIIADIATTNLVDGAEPGLPLLLSYAGTGNHPVADIIMQNTDNATVLSRFQQIFGQLGGEFTIDVAWSADGQSLIPTLRWGDRIGAVRPAGLDPAVTFEMPGVLIAFNQTEQYGQGKGANKVVAYSTGQGSFSPYAPAAVVVDGRPTFEHRYQPVQSTADIPTLTVFAQQALKILAPGAVATVLTASTAQVDGRRLGADWQLGDDIGYRVAAQDTDGHTILAFPNGAQGIGRSIAYELTDISITPILADAAVYVGQ